MGDRLLGQLVTVGRRWISVGALLLAALGGTVTPVLANGGTIQVSEQPVGLYRVTVMTSPSPLRTGTADVSVMVTLANSSTVAEDLTIGVAVAPVGKTTAPAHYLATHANATNKLFYAANVPLEQAGHYAFTVHVAGSKGSGDVRFQADVGNGLFGYTPFQIAMTVVPIAGFVFFVIVTSSKRGATEDVTRDLPT